MRGNRAAIAVAFTCFFGSVASAQATRRISVGLGGAQANGASFETTMTPDGRYVAFYSDATNLVPGDTNGVGDIFVLDLEGGTIERASVASGGVQAGGGGAPVFTPDGRFVLFTSYAADLVPGDTNSSVDAFVHDRWTGTTERVSVASDGTEGNFHSFGTGISADGRYVAFESWASNLVPGDSNGFMDVFVHDRQTGTTERESLDSNGAQANHASEGSTVSADGRYAAFVSYASNLVVGDANGVRDVFVHDRQTGTTVRESVDPAGEEANQESYGARFSADGRFLAFASVASNLVPGTPDGKENVFVRDLQHGSTELASLAWNGVPGNDSSFYSGISSDGRFVTFTSWATDLVIGDDNGSTDLFVRDRQSGTTERLNLSSGGAEGNADVGAYTGDGGVISDDGVLVAFASRATNVAPGDTNGATDVFLRDRRPVAPAFTSLCAPGSGGVVPCPCGNPPAGPGRGCDNSAGTGGAMLIASGNTQLSADGLSFATSGELSETLSILVQGNVLVPGGLVYGQGVRCQGGNLRRLYSKTAVGGAILAPDLASGDPPVSVRSQQKGETIHPGDSRWYAVYYRTPTVLGGCPATSTFNATQTGRIDWSM